jgi:chloramphenicol O-acetyltransferase
MFRRTVKGILPDVRSDYQQLMDEELCNQDQSSKFNRNVKEDIRRKALVSQVKRDKTDTVLLALLPWVSFTQSNLPTMRPHQFNLSFISSFRF